MPSYKFIYFDYRGRGEVCRLLFALAGQEYEDVRIKPEDWPHQMNKTPFQQLPVLEIDGKSYTYSTAIARYLAKTFGFYGDSDIRGLEIDQVLGIVQDTMDSLLKVHYEQDAARKLELMKTTKSDILPKYLNMLEKILTENSGSGFCVGHKITIADVFTFDLCEKLDPYFKLDVYPLIRNCREMFCSSPNIETYLSTRPLTEQ